MKKQLLALVAKLDALARRDRWMLAAGLLAALAGVEYLFVLPLNAKRHTVEQSVTAASSSQSEAQAAAHAEAAARLSALQARNALAERALAALGLKSSKVDSLSAFLERALRGQAVNIVALRGLPVEALNLSAAPADAAVVAGAPAPEAASALPAAPLFRHRAELKLQGAVPSLTQAIGVLERDLAPLRIERVLIGAQPGGAVQATVVLTTVSAERTWLAL